MSGQHVVIVTGGRSFPHSLKRVVEGNLNTLYVLHGPFILFHGACQPRGSDEMTGADRYADDWAQTAPGIDLRCRPADWDRHGDAAGPIRNAGMVREALELAPVPYIHGLAFPEPGSRGTRNCMRLMRDAGIRVDVWDVPRSRRWLAVQGVPDGSSSTA